ncbi:MAG: hypothetical protein KGM42_09335 [Hyphomicrobiales bacterium]|nr:hypothetical protein [Hyphomicrobiales bacterium]
MASPLRSNCDRKPSAPGLYFLGAKVVPTGQVREIGVGATRVAALAKEFVATQRAAAH